jgi:hypothetical protein
MAAHHTHTCKSIRCPRLLCAAACVAAAPTKPQRTGIYVSVGVLLGAVAVHYWYDFLETKVANPAKVRVKRRCAATSS